MTRESFDLDNKGWANDPSNRSGKRNAVELTLVQIGFVIMSFCIITTSVALMVYYLSDRPVRDEVTYTKSPVDVSKNPVTNLITLPHSPAASLSTQMPSTISGEGSTTPIPSTVDPFMVGRLPRTVLPRRYLLNIRPYLYDDDAPYATLNRTSTFDGWVRIEVECMTPTDEIVLHADGLTLHGSPTVIGLDTGDSHDLLDHHTLNDHLMFLILNLKTYLQPDKHYEIRVSFSGPMAGITEGFYVSKYYNSEGELRLTAGTQMEGPYARRVLPCFDEPSFKASFDVQIEHRSNMSALSNGMETSTVQLDDHWSRTYFKRVAAMSTYLLAMVVHDFESINGTTEDGCLVRVWMQPDYIQDVRTALDDAIKLQTFFTSYSDLKYPLDKLDHIGIALMQGAMENWGLIIYDEDVLTEDDDLTITHEVSHQWFGNLVTPEWWDDLWLNEGFASYFQHIGMDYLDPDQKEYENFYQVTMSSALNVDVQFMYVSYLKAPVSYETDDIQNQLVTFTYNKGCAIVFMMKHLLADGVFQKGIRNYLKERSYKNANIDHLWKELTYADQDVGKHDMKQIMDSWTLQPGAPLVTLNRTGNSLVAKQERMYIGFPNAPEPFSERYYIPLSFVHQRDPMNPKHVMLEPQSEETLISLDDALDDDWYLANFMQTGYYYVNYDHENWQRIVDQADKDPNVFTYQNQIGLMSQTQVLWRADMIPLEIHVALLNAFRNTTRGTRMAALEADMNDLKMLSDGRKSTKAIEASIREGVDALYEETGWEEDSMVDPLITRRYTAKKHLDITSLACLYGNSDCVDRATKLFEDVMASPQTQSLKPIYRHLVYCNGIRYGGQAEWYFAWRQMQDTSDRSEKTRWEMALSCSRNASALSSYVETLPSHTSSDLHLLKVIMALAENPIAGDLVWEFVKSNWDQLYSRNALDSYGAGDLLLTVTSSFNTADKFQELLDFGNGRDFGPLQSAYAIAVSEASKNLMIATRHLK